MELLNEVNARCVSFPFIPLILIIYSLKTLGDAEMALTDDCLYSQVIGMGCCGDRGVLRIPILSIRDIRQQSCENSLCDY